METPWMMKSSASSSYRAMTCGTSTCSRVSETESRTTCRRWREERFTCCASAANKLGRTNQNLQAGGIGCVVVCGCLSVRLAQCLLWINAFIPISSLLVSFYRCEQTPMAPRAIVNGRHESIRSDLLFDRPWLAGWGLRSNGANPIKREGSTLVNSQTVRFRKHWMLSTKGLTSALSK